jgi:hypothetical protein
MTLREIINFIVDALLDLVWMLLSKLLNTRTETLLVWSFYFFGILVVVGLIGCLVMTIKNLRKKRRKQKQEK